jgi:hypothetical protein
MSDNRSRCPNCAWAFWQGRTLDLPTRERILLIAIAERAGDDLQCTPSQITLAKDTGMTKRTVISALQSLAARGDCISVERRREGLRYTLIRPRNAQAKPFPWRSEDDSASKAGENPSPPIPTESENPSPPIPTESENPSPPIPTESENPSPPQSENAAPPPGEEFALSSNEVPLNKTPLKKESSLRSLPRACVQGDDLAKWEIAFKAFYALYPRKVGVDDARKAFLARMRERIAPDEIILGLQRQLPKLRTNEKRYIKLPAGWLREGRWRDEAGIEIDPALRAALTAEEIEAFENGAMPYQSPMLLALAGGRS